jgi:hypothetical protein
VRTMTPRDNVELESPQEFKRVPLNSLGCPFEDDELGQGLNSNDEGLKFEDPLVKAMS